MKLPHPWVLTPVSAPRPGSLWSLHLLGESIPSPSLCPGSQLSRLRAGALSNLATQHRPLPQSQDKQNQYGPIKLWSCKINFIVQKKTTLFIHKNIVRYFPKVRYTVFCEIREWR